MLPRDEFCLLLAPNRAVVRMLGIQAGPLLDGLTLLDEKGQKAIIARTWRTNFVRGNDFGPAYPLIRGMDVLIRPDLLEILEQKCSPNSICFCSRHIELADDELGWYSTGTLLTREFSLLTLLLKAGDNRIRQTREHFARFLPSRRIPESTKYRYSPTVSTIGMVSSCSPTSTKR